MPRRLWVDNRPLRFVSVYIPCYGPWSVYIPRFTHWMYTFHRCQLWNVHIQWLACGMYTFHAWPIECIHSTVIYIQCNIYIRCWFAWSMQLVEHSTSWELVEQVNFGYSMKKVPVHSNKDYMMRLIKSTEKFVRHTHTHIHCFLTMPKPFVLNKMLKVNKLLCSP